MLWPQLNSPPPCPGWYSIQKCWLFFLFCIEGDLWHHLTLTGDRGQLEDGSHALLVHSVPLGIRFADKYSEVYSNSVKMNDKYILTVLFLTLSLPSHLPVIIKRPLNFKWDLKFHKNHLTLFFFFHWQIWHKVTKFFLCLYLNVKILLVSSLWKSFRARNNSCHCLNIFSVRVKKYFVYPK